MKRPVNPIARTEAPAALALQPSSAVHKGIAWVRNGVSCLLLAFGLSAPPNLDAASLLSTNGSALLPPPLPDADFSVIRVFGALTLVIALFLAGVWIFKNWHRVRVGGRPQNLQVLESRSLGGRHALYVVGYQGQRLLLSASPNGVSLLSHLPNGEAESLPAPERSGAAGQSQNQQFVHALQQALQQKS